MKRIGITGGIGSGKSLVSTILRLKGIPVYDADTESKRIITSDEHLRQQLIHLLGSEIYFDDGSLNKKFMASKIFNQENLLLQVNKIVHPAVGKDFLRWSEKQNNPIVAMETALLFESKMQQYLDKTILVYAPLDIRLQRAIHRDNSTKEQILARVKHQMADEEKKELANFIIVNDDKQAILPQIQSLIQMLY